MSKTKETALATPASGGALAKPSAEWQTGYQMEGEDRSDTTIPRLILHQGKQSRVNWGDFPEGTLINSLTKQPLASKRFLPLRIAQKFYIRYGEKYGDPIVYFTRNRDEVPPADLEWSVDANGKPIKPKCHTFREFIVLFEGEPFPICLSLRTHNKHQNSAGRNLNTFEKDRDTRGLPPGLYELVVVEDKKDSNVWQTLDLKPAGNPTNDMLVEAMSWRKAILGAPIKVDDTAVKVDAGNYDPENDG